MRRRLATAIVGMVTAALILSGLGTIVLAAVANRADTEADLREQADAIGGLLAELTFAPADNATSGTLRQRLQRVAASMSVDGIGIIIVPRNADPIGELPAGVTIDDIDIEAVRAGETLSGRTGSVIWAARATTNRAGVAQLLVMTGDPAPIVQPAFRWFLLAGSATIAIAVIVTVRVSRRLTDPIRETATVAGRIADGDMEARIPPEAAEVGDEVGELVEAVNAMADEVQRAQLLERQFLMSVSHDLRTPLTSIKGYAEALSDGAVDDVERVGSVIEAEAGRLERLVGDLLLLARLGSTDFPLDARATDVTGLVEAAATGLRADADARGVTLSVRVPDAPTLVVVDPDRLAQVVGNLVGNAIRFADHEVAATLWTAEGRVHLAVGDDGRGIADADLPHVFDRLYVAKHNPSVKESGSGLGLAIVRDLTERMGGAVTARRSAMGGAEFVISFPPAPAPSP